MLTSKEAVLTAIVCARQRQLPILQPPLWQNIMAFCGCDDYPDDPEGVFELIARGSPLRGRAGNGKLSISLSLVGSSFGTPESNYRLWSSHPTTTTSLPTVVADVVTPGWRAEVGRCTRLCCELGFQHPRRTTTFQQVCLFCPVTDWRGCMDSWAGRRGLSSSNSYIAYYSSRCRRSLGYVVHRLAQIQVDRETDSFQVVDRQRGIGYGVKEYAYSEQIRKPSFTHLPLVLVELDHECCCGASDCGANGPRCVSTEDAAELSSKLKCPLVQTNGSEGFTSVFDALVAECHRLDSVTCLGAVSVPRGALPCHALHLGDGIVEQKWWLSMGCCMM